MRILLCILSISLGNFLYEGLQTVPSWMAAFKDSYFGAVAILLYVFVFQPKTNPQP